MTEPPKLEDKRVAIGLFSITCLIGAGALILWPGHDALQGALIRVGILLAAFWLVLGSPRKWKGLSSNWLIVGGILAAIMIRQVRALFPVLVVIAGIAWFARPRK